MDSIDDSIINPPFPARPRKRYGHFEKFTNKDFQLSHIWFNIAANLRKTLRHYIPSVKPPVFFYTNSLLIQYYLKDDI